MEHYLGEVFQARARHVSIFSLMPIKQLERERVTTEMSSTTLVQEGTSPDRLLTWNNADQFIFAKRVYRATQNGITCLGKFESIGDLINAEDMKEEGKKDLKDAIHAMENIFAVSSDGKWAVSGFCVYSVATRTPRKLLPIPCTIQSFTADGRGLYLIGKRGIYFFPDWESQFPDVSSK